MTLRTGTGATTTDVLTSSRETYAILDRHLVGLYLFSSGPRLNPLVICLEVRVVRVLDRGFDSDCRLLLVLPRPRNGEGHAGSQRCFEGERDCIVRPELDT